MTGLKTLFSLLKETFDEWNNDRAPRLAAALAYYTAFSIAPLLIIVIAVAGLAFGQEAVRGRLDNQIQGLVGRQAADTIQEIVANVSQPQTSFLASLVSIITLILGAIGLFGQLQDALDTVWGVTPRTGQGIVEIIRQRFASFTMVLGIAFLLLVSLVISAILSALSDFTHQLLPGAEVILQIANVLISFLVITLLFAMIYKILPDVQIAWRDVWLGAMVTALLFTVGKFLIGLYLGNSSVASTYGAAGSFVVLLLWVYYSAQILLFGAEFTQVYARRYGSKIIPAKNAVPVTTEARAEQGMSPLKNVPSPETTIDLDNMSAEDIEKQG